MELMTNPLHLRAGSWHATEDSADAKLEHVDERRVVAAGQDHEQKEGQTGRSTRRRGALFAYPSASAAATTRDVTWFSLYGCEGILVVTVLIAALVLICVLIAAHCSESLLQIGSGATSTTGPRFALRPYIGLTPGLSVALGVIFSMVGAVMLWTLSLATCRWRSVVFKQEKTMLRRSVSEADRRLSLISWKCPVNFRTWAGAWALKPGSPYFVLWKFRAKVWDVVSQTAAMHVYSAAGVPMSALLLFASTVLVNAAGVLFLTVRGRTFRALDTARAWRLMVIIDVLCDLHFCVFPLYTCVISFVSLPMFLDSASKSRAAAGLVVDSFYTTRAGLGSLIFKLATRLVPLAFSTRSAYGVLTYRARQRYLARLSESCPHLAGNLQVMAAVDDTSGQRIGKQSARAHQNRLSPTRRRSSAALEQRLSLSLPAPHRKPYRLPRWVAVLFLLITYSLWGFVLGKIFLQAGNCPGFMSDTNSYDPSRPCLVKSLPVFGAWGNAKCTCSFLIYSCSHSTTNISALINRLDPAPLQYLNVYNCSGSEVVLALEHFAETAYLEIYQGGLRTIPPALFRLVKLRVLTLRSLAISRLPEAGWGNLDGLGSLYLLDLKLAGLPEAIGQLKWLAALSVAHNDLQRLPASFGRLTYLNHLTLSDNRLSRIEWATFSSFADNLQALYLSNALAPAGVDHMMELSQANGGVLPLPPAPNLWQITLSNSGIPDPMPRIRPADFSNLLLLDLTANNFSTVPNWVRDTAWDERGTRIWLTESPACTIAHPLPLARDSGALCSSDVTCSPGCGKKMTGQDHAAVDFRGDTYCNQDCFAFTCGWTEALCEQWVFGNGSYAIHE